MPSFNYILNTIMPFNNNAPLFLINRKFKLKSYFIKKINLKINIKAKTICKKKHLKMKVATKISRLFYATHFEQ